MLFYSVVSKLQETVVAPCDIALNMSLDKHGCPLRLDWHVEEYNREAVVLVFCCCCCSQAKAVAQPLSNAESGKQDALIIDL